MCLAAELLAAELEEGHDLGCEALGGAEALAEEHDLGDGLSVGGDHGDGAEELLEVVGEVAAARVAGVHRDEDACRRVEALHALAAAEVEAGVAVADALLDGLDLLRHGGQRALLEPVELVKAAPRAAHAEPRENAAHRGRAEALVAAEHHHLLPELRPQRLHALRLPCPGRPEWVRAHLRVQRLRHRQVHLVDQLCPHNEVRHPEVLPPVPELRVRNPQRQCLQRVCCLLTPAAVVIPQIVQPLERLGAALHLCAHQVPRHVALVHQRRHQVLALLPRHGVQILQHTVRKDLELRRNVLHNLFHSRRRGIVLLLHLLEGALNGLAPEDLSGDDHKLPDRAFDPREKPLLALLAGDPCAGLCELAAGGDCAGKEASEGLAGVALDEGEPLVAGEPLGGRGACGAGGDEGDVLRERDGLALGGLDACDDVGVRGVEGEGADAGEHLLEVLLGLGDVAGVADDLEEVLVADEVEARERRALLLEVVAERLLDARQLVCERGDALDALDGRDLERHVELAAALHDLLELLVHDAELCCLAGQQPGALAARVEDALEVHPLALDVDHHLQHLLQPRQPPLPLCRLLRKVREVRRRPHRSQARQVVRQLREQLVPVLDQHRLVLVVHEVQPLLLAPLLAHLLQELLQAQLALRKRDHLPERVLVLHNPDSPHLRQCDPCAAATAIRAVTSSTASGADVP